MGLFDSAFGGFGAVHYGPSSSASDPNGWFVRVLNGGKTKAGIAVSAHNALQSTSVYAAVNRIGNPIGHFPLDLFERKSGSTNAVEVTQHPMSGRLRLRPNDYMSSRTLRKTMQSHALLWGNGYIEIERNNAGSAVSLWPLLAWNTSPHRQDGKVRFRTTIDGTQFELDPDNVVHIMDLSQDGYIGLSQISLARHAIGMALAMEEFGAKFFANDAKSGGFLMHPGRLGPQAFKNLNQTASSRYAEETPATADASNPASRLERQGGLDNAHRVKVLEEGMKFVPTMIPPEDAQFLGSREFQIAEIARMYDVPLILLQSHEKSTSWGTGIEQLMIGFIRQTVAPWVNAWEQEMNWKLFTEEERKKGLFVKFNMNAYLRGDSEARAALYKALFEMGGLTPNQICALEDVEGFGADGDRRFVSNNVQPLDRVDDEPDAGQEPPKPTAPAAPQKETAE